MTTKNVSRKNQSIAVRKMVTAAMLGAVTAVLTFTPIGMIPLPPPLLHATTVHVPVILAALVEGPLVDSLLERVDLNDDASMAYFERVLRRGGVIDALRKAGAQDGSSVRLGEIEFDFID